MSGVVEIADSDCSRQPARAALLDAALDRIRAGRRCHSAVAQIRALLPIAPARAAWLLLELAETDLRDKVARAGLAVAEAAARLARLPRIASADELPGYTIDDLLDLACAMCLLDPAERRRLDHAWERGRAVEPDEDAFLACIDLVLAREPVSPLRDITLEMILEALPGSAWTKELILNFASAPDQAQIQIENFLMQVIGDDSRPAPIRDAALIGLRILNAAARRSVQSRIGDVFKTQLRRRLGTLPDMRISAAIGIAPYLTESRIRLFFAHFLHDAQQPEAAMRDEALTSFLDEFHALGGLAAVQPELRSKLVLWMVRGYVGAPDRPGRGGEAEPPLFARIERLFRDAAGLVAEDFEAAAASDVVRAAAQDEAAARRLDALCRLVRDGA
jgi:hypothetical protein